MKTFLKKHRKLMIFLLVVVIVGVLIFMNIQKQMSILPEVEVVTIEKGSLVNSVRVDGVVESENNKKIYTQLALPVKDNLVEVGDVVKEGDVLCELDARTLEETIEQQRAAAASQAAINNRNVELAKKAMDTSATDVEGSQNSAIASAEHAVIQAEQQLKAAEVAYDTSVDVLQEHRKTRKENGIYFGDDVSDVALQNYMGQRDSAFAAYESAKEGLKIAKENLEITINSVENQLTNLQDSIKTNEIMSSSTNSQWVAIENLQGDVERSVITAPMSGTVTAVYVTEGSTATGLLYVVEDLSKLKVTANLKEYDLSYIEKGNNTIIKSDATGDEEFQGKVEKIAPTTKKTPTGDNVLGTTGEFITEIIVDGKDKALMVGTKARVDIVYEKKDDVLMLPADAVGVNEEGKDVVYILEPDAKDGFVVKAVPVTIGMQGDFDVEILKSDLGQDAQIVKRAKDVFEGMRVKPMQEESEKDNATPNGGLQSHVAEKTA